MGSSREDLFRGFTRVVRSYVELRIVIEAGPATMTGVEAGYPWHARQWPCGQSLGTCAKGGLILKYFWRFWSGFLPDVASFVPELLITSNRELISPLHRCELRPCLRSPPATISAFVSGIVTVISAPTADRKGVVCLILISVDPEQPAQQPYGDLAYFGSPWRRRSSFPRANRSNNNSMFLNNFLLCILAEN